VWKIRAKDFLEDIEQADRVMGSFVAKTTYQMGMERRKHHSDDVEQFARRVFRLLAWQLDKNESYEYVAPYVALVQSSGMGKTKLLYDLKTKISRGEASDVFTALQPEFPFLRNDSKISCKMILCYTQSVINRHADDGYYDDILVPESIIGGSTDHEEIAYRMWRKLDDIISGRHERVILLIDEAQLLLEENAGCKHLLFRCLQKWLRQVRMEHVVAVISGTSLDLLDDYEDIDVSFRRGSRDNRGFYTEHMNKLYPPFYHLTTMACFSDDPPLSNDIYRNDTESTEYDRAVRYGRPLFALMQQDGTLQERHGNILHRMLLGVDRGWSWYKCESSWLSILATRVQMPSISRPVATELLHWGYANLISFEHKSAQVAYLADPVCARLAMAIMDPLGQYVSLLRLQMIELRKLKERVNAVGLSN